MQVTGVLKPSDVFFPPFKPFCNECKQLVITMEFPIDDMLYCTKCAHKTSYSYEHNLQCTMHKIDDKINCTLPRELLQQFFPKLVQISFAQYKQNISETTFLLRGFSINGTFTITMDNIIVDVKTKLDMLAYLHVSSFTLYNLEVFL
jgi:hypothetical protein